MSLRTRSDSIEPPIKSYIPDPVTPTDTDIPNGRRKKSNHARAQCM